MCLRQGGELLDGTTVRTLPTWPISLVTCMALDWRSSCWRQSFIKREEYDVFFLFAQARRRAAFRAANRNKAGGLWESASADTGSQLSRSAKAIAASQRAPRKRALLNCARPSIGWPLQAISSKRPARTANFWREAPDSVFPEQRQLELANQFYAESATTRMPPRPMNCCWSAFRAATRPRKYASFSACCMLGS